MNAESVMISVVLEIESSIDPLESLILDILKWCDLI